MTRRLWSLPALLCAGCLGLNPLDDDDVARVEAFDFYWQQLADNYPFFGRDLIDWSEVRRQYRAAVPFASRPHEFYHLLFGMFCELGDPHVSFQLPDEAFVENGVQPTSLLDRPGFELMLIGGRLHVVGWPGGRTPLVPEDLGEGPHHPELWRVEGHPVVTSLVSGLMLGPPGSEVELQLRWANGVATRHVVERPQQRPARGNAWFVGLTTGGDGLALVDRTPTYDRIEIGSMGAELPMDDIDRWIDEAMEKDGLVLDLRRNLGGQMDVSERLLSRFLARPAEIVFVTPEERATWIWPFSVELFLSNEIAPRGRRYDKPIVVLTSSMTASMAEHAARILQRECGAIVIGERTAGAEAGIRRAYGPDGGVLKYGETRIIDRSGVGLQDEGVVPDVSVRLQVRDVVAYGPRRAVREWEIRLLRAAERAIRSARRP